MTKTITKTSDYSNFLNDIKERILNARINAARIVNRELISLYWTIGKNIIEKQEKFGWGKAVVERLSLDLKKEFPETTGFSPRNLWDMRRLYDEYHRDEKLRQLVAEIPWGQNLIIINKVKDSDARLYYIRATAELGWSRNVLLNQIKACAYERHLVHPKQHNFDQTLPVHLYEQADKSMKAQPS